MQEANQRRWHPVGTGQTGGLVFWKFTGKEIPSFSSAVGGGFTAFFILQNFGVPLVICLAIGGLIPITTIAYLLALVCGKPASYAACVIEGLWLQACGRALFEFNPKVLDEKVD